MANFKEEILFTCKIGFFGVVIISLLLAVGGFLFGGFEVIKAVSVWRSGMCIITGIMLIIVGGMILFKRKFIPDEHSHWKARFKKLGYSSVLGIIAVMFIIGTIIADYIFLYIK